MFIDNICGFLNSVSVIVLAITIGKNGVAIKRLKEANETQRINNDKRKCEIQKLREGLSSVSKDVKNIRLEIVENRCKSPISENEFSDWSSWVEFSCGVSIKESFLDYIAEMALKTIASELPEEKRTPEVISNIASRIDKQLGKSKILL